MCSRTLLQSLRIVLLSVSRKSFWLKMPWWVSPASPSEAGGAGSQKEIGMMDRAEKPRPSSLLLICSAGPFPSPALITQVN